MAKEDHKVHPDQRQEFRAQRKAFEGQDQLQNQVTAAPGVSDRGIEVRRGDTRIPANKVVAHGYARVYSDPSKHMSNAKDYFRAVHAKISSQPKPNLGKSEEVLSKSWKFNPATKQLNHPLHGSIAIKPHKSGGFQAVHNGASIGVFSDQDKLRQGLHNYTNSLPSHKPMTRMINAPSTASGMGKDEARGYGKPPAPGQTSNSPQVNPQAAKEIQAGVNWSMGQKMDYYKQNLMNGLGLGKAEAYFKGLLQKSKK